MEQEGRAGLAWRGPERLGVQGWAGGSSMACRGWFLGRGVVSGGPALWGEPWRSADWDPSEQRGTQETDMPGRAGTAPHRLEAPGPARGLRSSCLGGQTQAGPGAAAPASPGPPPEGRQLFPLSCLSFLGPARPWPAHSMTPLLPGDGVLCGQPQPVEGLLAPRRASACKPQARAPGADGRLCPCL